MNAVSSVHPAEALHAASLLRSLASSGVAALCLVSALGCGGRDNGQKLRAELQKTQARLQKLEQAASARKAHLAGLEAAFVKLRDGLGSNTARQTQAPAATARPPVPDVLGAEAAMREGAFLEGFLILAAEQERITAAMAERWDELNTFMQALIGDDAPEELRQAANQLAVSAARRVRDLARRQQALIESFRALAEPGTGLETILP